MGQSLVNIEKLTLQPFKRNIFSLSRRNIAKLYEEMYQLAESIAIHEMNKFESRLRFNRAYRKVMLKGEHDDEDVLSEKISNYRDERLNHHMNAMKELHERMSKSKLHTTKKSKY